MSVLTYLTSSLQTSLQNQTKREGYEKVTSLRSGVKLPYMNKLFQSIKKGVVGTFNFDGNSMFRHPGIKEMVPSYVLEKFSNQDRKLIDNQIIILTKNFLHFLMGVVHLT